jgi:hypothetical protein
MGEYNQTCDLVLRQANIQGLLGRDQVLEALHFRLRLKLDPSSSMLGLLWSLLVGYN